MLRPSMKLRVAIKLGGTHAYVIAHAAGLHPAVLSRLLSGAERTRPNDARLLAVARVLGIPEGEAFEESEEKPETAPIDQTRVGVES